MAEKGSKYIRYGGYATAGLTGVILIALFFNFQDMGVLQIYEYNYGQCRIVYNQVAETIDCL